MPTAPALTGGVSRPRRRPWLALHLPVTISTATTAITEIAEAKKVQNQIPILPLSALVILI